MKVTPILAIIVLFLACSNSAWTQQPETPAVDEDAVKSVDVRVGDTWIYKVVNETTGQISSTTTYSVTEIADGKITTAVKFVNERGEDKDGAALFDMRWGMLRWADMTYSKPDMTYGVAVPFKVGSRWTSSFDLKKPNWPQPLRSSSTSKVISRETLTLPSGETYDTFRIESDLIGKTRDGTVRATVKATFWYDPKINRYVQRVAEQRTDGLLMRKEKDYLVSFTRKDDK